MGICAIFLELLKYILLDIIKKMNLTFLSLILWLRDVLWYF